MHQAPTKTKTKTPASPAFTPPSSPPSAVSLKTSPSDLSSLLIESARLAVRIRKAYAHLKECPDAKYYTYSLLLQDGHVYVGNSDNIYTRFMAHFEQSPDSSQWVREHGPVSRVLEIIRNSSRDDEHYLTLQWCDMVGAHKVRGAAYCRVDARQPPAPLATFRRDAGRTFDYLSRPEIDEIVRVAKSLGKDLFK